MLEEILYTVFKRKTMDKNHLKLDKIDNDHISTNSKCKGVDILGEILNLIFMSNQNVNRHQHLKIPHVDRQNKSGFVHENVKINYVDSIKRSANIILNYL